MGLNWPVITSEDGNLDEGLQRGARAQLDKFAEIVVPELGKLDLPSHASPLWKPWSLVAMRDSQKFLYAFSPLTGGIATIQWRDQGEAVVTPQAFTGAVKGQLGWDVSAVVILPFVGAINEDALLQEAALQHVNSVERANRLGRLGDLTGVQHLESYLRDFLNDHPNPERNVFVMMRFLRSDQLDEAHAAVKHTLAKRGFDAVRADDRDYTGELWSNIEVYLTCCKYGVAVFEDIEQRDFNPNVSLELGYMLGRRKRCLILKEQRLPNLPADVIHRLYKPFDMFKVRESVSREVARWIDVDLGFGPPRS